MMWGNGLNGWGMAFMTFSNVLFLVLAVGGIILLVRYLDRSYRLVRPHGELPATPQQVLAQRFARGEIDEEEYTRRLQVLGQDALHRAGG
jgi:putative membrane protein